MTHYHVGWHSNESLGSSLCLAAQDTESCWFCFFLFPLPTSLSHRLYFIPSPPYFSPKLLKQTLNCCYFPKHLSTTAAMFSFPKRLSKHAILLATLQWLRITSERSPICVARHPRAPPSSHSGFPGRRTGSPGGPSTFHWAHFFLPQPPSHPPSPLSPDELLLIFPSWTWLQPPQKVFLDFQGSRSCPS